MFQSGAVTDDMKMIALRKHYVAKNVFGADPEPGVDNGADVGAEQAEPERIAA